MIKILIRVFLVISTGVLLVSCGGSPSGQGPSSVTPTPPPPPAPINYNTVEFRNNYGLAQIKALAAYDAGASGAGITVAVIDSGIDIDNSQIQANIHVDSTNIATGNKADLNDLDGHGTGVSGVIAAIRNPSDQSNVNTHGVAFNAQIMALNAASVGSCESADGCTFSDPHIAQALDYARVRGVKVVNISLGGDGFNSFVLVEAYKRAVNAGMVIILAAGNRDTGDTDLILSQPENSASAAWAPWANGQIIVAGAVDQSATFSTDSHKAGIVAKDVFLVAAGVDVPSIGLPDPTTGEERFFLWSGTSFAAPHISGAAALLFEAFPNLTGAEVADLLFTTATDLGAVGSDVIYGRGLVNLEEAFKPQGTTSIAVKTAAGSSTIVGFAGSALLGGEAFGGFVGLAAGLEDSLLLDGYNRSFRVDLGQRVFGQGQAVRLDNLIGSRRGSRTSSLKFGLSAKVDLSWREDWRFQEVEENYFSNQNTAKNRARDLRMKLNLTLNKKQSLTFAQGLSVKEALEDYDQDEFLTIGREDFLALVGRKNSQTAVFGQKLNGRTKFGLVMSHGAAEWQQYRLKANSYVMMARLDHRLTGSVALGVDLGVMDEKGSILGSLSSGAVSLGKGATTRFINGRFDWAMTGGLNFFARASYGLTKVAAAELSLVEKIGNLKSGSFSIGLMGDSLFQKGDRLSFAVSQPLRVMGGYADISYVSARNYQTDSLSFVSNQVSLIPGGREIDFELAYRMADIFGARLDLNVLHQINPSHNRASKDNTGVLLRLGSVF